MLFRELAEQTAWEGKDPTTFDLEKAGFKAVPIKQGDVFVIHGALDHLSLPNTSPDSRHTYQLHLVEGPAAGVEWAPSNWLQLPGRKPFPAI